MFVRHNIRPPHFASKVSYSASPQSFATCLRIVPWQLQMQNRRVVAASSLWRLALSITIVCCGASIVAHFARKVRATNM